MEKFYLDDYLKEKENKVIRISFHEACNYISEAFNKEWEESQSRKELLLLQKKAIIGYRKEREYFQHRIDTLLSQGQYSVYDLPKWYDTVSEGIYHELWGLAGIAEWFHDKYVKSTSAKIIGDNIYYLNEGKLELMPQKISMERREQLVRAFLLINTEEQINKNIHHLYLLDGTRVTVYKNKLTKKGQEVIIFRRYVVTDYTFEEQARRGTIPENSIPLFKKMVALGYNCAFVGQIRSAKTTFLATWQSYEDKNLEGVLVETDPEIPIHEIMPGVPIMQLIADKDELKGIVKLLMRSDADYFIIGEARDGVALDTALRIADRGGRRLKMTFHIKNPKDFPYIAAEEIAHEFGGNIDKLAVRVAGAFDYIFFFSSLADKNVKKLISIYEIRGSRSENKITMEQICQYNHENNRWSWYYHMGDDKVRNGELENREILKAFQLELQQLAKGG